MKSLALGMLGSIHPPKQLMSYRADKFRFKPYWIAVRKGDEAKLEFAMRDAGFVAFIVGDAEEYGSLEKVERKYAPSTSGGQAVIVNLLNVRKK